jgi:acetyltransferase-like isoleucine patch superfamily enzyme
MGDGVHTGINASINPGTLIGDNAMIGPGAMVSGTIAPSARTL